jgi:transcription antitermination factor NusG
LVRYEELSELFASSWRLTVNRIETERGGACAADALFPANEWHVIWTRSNCEQLVHQQLSGKGFETFLPTMGAWRTRAGARRRIDVPMFPGYLFVRGLVDKKSHVEVRKARGLVQVLGQCWDRPAVVPEREVGAIQTLTQSALETFATPFLQQGQRVRVVFGPLTGVEGTLLRSNSHTGLLVLSVTLLQRSVAAEVHCSAVAPI